MQRLEVSGAVRPIYGSLGVKRLMHRVILINLRYAIVRKLLAFIYFIAYKNFLFLSSSPAEFTEYSVRNYLPVFQ